jgi:hypothetical protein
VCTKAQTFRLPCERLVQVQNAMVVPEAASAE